MTAATMTLPCTLVHVTVVFVLAGGAVVSAAPASGRHEDLPPVGRSLFDHAVAHDVDGTRLERVPFPFTALVAHLAARVGGASAAGLRQVLIPLGRSLQRSAAAPGYFDHPRVVVAFDGERSGADGLFLRDRLYLGYQDAADLVEVISYNARAARFEFQVVRDYREGAVADVRYANRSLCLACHQNAAPIFSRRPWSETNANPQVGALLARRAATFHGVPARGGVDIAQAVDDATDRANRFATWQALWRDGCGPDAEAAARCRRDALLLALARRLAVPGSIEPEASRLAGVLRAAWPRHWPRDLVIPDADLPNRDPFEMLARRHGTLTVDGPTDSDVERLVGTLMSRNAIPSRLEPLEPRAGVERLDSVQAIDGGRFVAGIGEFFSNDDLAWLDDALAARRQARADVARTVVTLDCEFVPAAGAGGPPRLSARCGTADAGDTLHARLYLQDGQVERVALQRLRLAGHAQVGLALDDLAYRRAEGERRVSAHPRRRHDGRRVWLTGGEVLERVEFVVAGDGALAGERRDGAVRLHVADGIGDLRVALAHVPVRSAAGDDASPSGDAMRRLPVMAALVERLGGAPRRWCCLDPAALPAARADRVDEAVTGGAPGDAVAGFIAHCGQCHRSRDPSPPNFLSGDADAVARGIAQCAERIHVRLAAWHQGAAATATPMPPVSALWARGLSEAQWRSGPALVSLRAHVRRLLDAEPGAAADRADALLARDYAGLRPCLAHTAQRAGAPGAGS